MLYLNIFHKQIRLIRSKEKHIPQVISFQLLNINGNTFRTYPKSVIVYRADRMPIKIDIDGFEVQLFEKMYDYVRNSNFSNYPDEEVDVSAFSEDNAEVSLPKVLVRKINLYENVDFLLGMPHEKQIAEYGYEFPETIELNGIEYTQVNFGEDEISYLKNEALDEPVHTLIYRTVKITNGVYLYVYPSDTEIFENEKEVQEVADEINCT
jgi:hypothetical protein